MIGVVEAFSSRYAEARSKFLQACVIANVSLDTHPLPLALAAGRAGEQLAVDVALDGPAQAERLLIVSSACHGVEGHCGSGVQVFSLYDAEWREKARAARVSVLYVHALNPHGYSYGRRVTQENVDLNRNFVDFSAPLPANDGYAALHPWLLPEQWPPTPSNEAQLSTWVDKHGPAAYQSAVSQGQYQFEDGLFFGGHAPTWSHRIWRDVLRRHASRAQRIAWIDLHTGLGPEGIAERIFSGRSGDAVALERACQWWGGDGATPVTSPGDGVSASSSLNGLMGRALDEECQQAERTGIVMEYGTLPLTDVISALRADHWLHRNPQAAPELSEAIHARMREAFYVDTHLWKGLVISQARQAMFQAVDGLLA